ncbi:MAG: formimidoylglutamate deiminase, partial [Solirubrobacteraceae bacterium]
GLRLAAHRRETLLEPGERSVGEVLFRAVCGGGAQALAQPCGAIRPGLRCDLVELDPGHTAALGQCAATILDAWIFSSASDAVVRTVIVGGRTVVSEGRHPGEEQARRRVAQAMRRLHDTAI